MKRLLLMVTLLLSISCGPQTTTVVGNPGNEARVQFLIRDEGAPLLIERAWIVGSKIRLIEKEDCTPNDKITKFETAVFTIDQANKPSNELTLPFYEERSSFCRIGLELTPATANILPDDAPQDLEGASLIVEAKRANDDTPLRIRLALTNIFSVSTAFSLKNKQRLFFVLDTNSWFTAPQLQDATTNEGTILITDTENPPLLTQMQTSLKTNAKLVLDANDNGVLDPEELENPLGSGGIVL